jgi:hypothetical protein
MLTKQLGAKDSALVFQFINDNHYLLGLASHPFLRQESIILTFDSLR